MSTYGIDLYGLSKYGSLSTNQGGGSTSTSNPTYLVQSISATQNGVARILLEIGPPTSPDYSLIRLVRNRYGYPIRYDDGVLLVEESGPLTAPLAYQDTGLEEGRLYYYSVFIFVAGDWYLSGAVTCLSVADYGYTQYLYDLVPRVYKAPMNELTDPGVDFENTPLKSFMEIIGFHGNMLRTEYELLLDSYEAGRVSLPGIYALGHELGVTLEPAITAYQHRQKVRSSAYVGRQKGTELGLRNAVNAATGWDVEIEYSANLMLNDEQSAARWPKFEDWNTNTNYPAGTIVKDGSLIYVALTETLGQPPTSNPLVWDPVSETEGYLYVGEWDETLEYEFPAVVLFEGVYYQVDLTPGTQTTAGLEPDVPEWVTVTPDVLVYGNAATSGYNSWDMVSYSGSITAVKDGIGVLVGTEGPTVPGDESGNVLTLTNTGGVAGTIGARHVARLTGAADPDRGQVAVGGVPFREPPLWSALASYQYGDVVLYEGNVYEALIESTDVTPSGDGASSAEWRFVSTSDYETYTASGYLKTMGTGRDVGVSICWYDQHGNLLGEVFNAPADQIFDGFDYTERTVIGDFGFEGASWTDPNSYWLANEGKAFGDPTATPPTFRPCLVTGYANAWVALTFRTAPDPGLTHGLLIRYQDANNHWRVSRTSLIEVNAGVATVRDTWTALADNERVAVKVDGDDFEVYRYLPVDDTLPWELEAIGSYTSSFLNSQTTYGIYETA